MTGKKAAEFFQRTVGWCETAKRNCYSSPLSSRLKIAACDRRLDRVLPLQSDTLIDVVKVSAMH